MRKPDSLKKVKHIHFTGIKGVGMTALACCAQDLGIKITGSDVGEIFVTDAVLKKRGIRWQRGFSPQNIKEPDLVITTGAHGGFKNPEVRFSLEKGIKTISQAEGFSLFSQGKEVVSVCGVGGKTTASSMMATVLDVLGLNPSFAIGVGQIYPLGDPGRMTKGKYFIAEADDYVVSKGVDDRPKFMLLQPKIIVCTNIEHDHPDVYSNLEATKKAFVSFFRKLPQDGILLACIDNKNIASLLTTDLGVSVQTYGFSPRADWRLERMSFAPGKVFFNLSYKGISFKNISLSVPGRFNALNAAAAFAVANFLGGDSRKIINGLTQFKGSRRRFELIGKTKRGSLYDDYAHHPTEIEATLKAARAWFLHEKIVVVFQPHTYSRTKALFEGFSQAFSQADEVLITQIYASAREEPIPGVTARGLAQAIKRHKKNTFYCLGKEEVISHLKEHFWDGEVIVTLGAGNIFLWHREILKLLRTL